ncbi:MAG: hypothetical protein NC398_06975 [Acetatifactor muris]|nr:hypothetical protein [Acetatifactor muris]MCM1525679.1 hypothetical protein [Bacteroides sp.]
MVERTEMRGGYEVTYYTVDIDDAMKAQAMDFARKLILTDNQYSRLLPKEVREGGDQNVKAQIEIQRTYMGKLGELAFVRLLRESGRAVDVGDMFTIYEGQTHVDAFDFKTATGHSVDVKTGFRDIHKRLLVNVEQFDRIPKDYYVGVKVYALDRDPELTLVDWNQITKADIFGYAEHAYMKNYAEIRDFGEGPARWLYYNRLLGIDRLIAEFPLIIPTI